MTSATLPEQTRGSTGEVTDLGYSPVSGDSNSGWTRPNPPELAAPGLLNQSRPAEVSVDIPGSLQLAANLVRRWITAGHVGLSSLVAAASAAFWLQSSGLGSSVPITPVSLCCLFVMLRVMGHERASGQLCCGGYVLCNVFALFYNGWALPSDVVYAQTHLQDTPNSLRLAAAYFFFTGVVIRVQPLSQRTTCAACVLGTLLQILVRLAVYLRTGNAASIMSVLACRTVSLAAGFVVPDHLSFLGGGQLVKLLEGLGAATKQWERLPQAEVRTERAEAEAARLADEACGVVSLMCEAKQMLLRHSPSGEITSVSEGCLALLGGQASQMVGTNFFDQVHAQDQDHVYAHLALMIERVETGQQRKGTRLTFRYMSGDGSFKLVESTALARINPACQRVTEVMQTLSPSAGRWVIPSGDLKMGDLIGEGSFGQVFMGVWRGSSVAVKKLKGEGAGYQPEECDLASFVERLGTTESGKLRSRDKKLRTFQHEVEVMCSLRHPNIILFMGVVLDVACEVWIVMEMMDGSLDILLVDLNVDLPYSLRVNMACDVARACQYLQEAGYVHQDLKTSNLLVDFSSMRIKVTDFGFTSLLGSNNQAKRRGCTPRYSAPELIRGEEPSPQSDIYAFAMILWELLWRCKPFESVSAEELAMLVMAGHRPPLPQPEGGWAYLSDYVTIITSSWQQEPHMRMAFSESLRRLTALANAENASTCQCGECQSFV